MTCPMETIEDLVNRLRLETSRSCDGNQSAMVADQIVELLSPALVSGLLVHMNGLQASSLADVRSHQYDILMTSMAISSGVARVKVPQAQRKFTVVRRIAQRRRATSRHGSSREQGRTGV